MFAFVANAENLGAITPPDLHFRIFSPPPISMREGTLIDYRIALWRFPMRWNPRISRWNPAYDFTNDQLSGPCATWNHNHRFHESAAGTTIEDHVSYELPFGPVGRVAIPLVRRQPDRIFSYRERRVRKLLQSSGTGTGGVASATARRRSGPTG